MGESHQHLIVKNRIYESLSDHPSCSKCKLERMLKGVRPDVSLYIGKTPVAIEVQRSDIRVDDICQRTQRYTELGIYLLWVLPDDSPLIYLHKDGENVHRIREWEKYLHAMYYGRVYYWQGGATVSPCHFDNFEAWVEPSNWFSEDGEEMSAGGYFRKTKSLKTLNMHDSLHIADDFRLTLRQKWIGKRWIVPRAKLWIDTLQKWW